MVNAPFAIQKNLYRFRFTTMAHSALLAFRPRLNLLTRENINVTTLGLPFSPNSEPNMDSDRLQIGMMMISPHFIHSYLVSIHFVLNF
jgi:hypothetical protein